MAEYQFVTTMIDPKEALRDVTSRRLIRKTATRATRSQQVNETSRRHRTQSEAIQEISQRKNMTKFRINRLQTSSQKPIPRPTHLPLWDPVVGPLGGQAWALLHYYRYAFRARSWAINAKREWFAFIIEDPVATHATLSFVSLNRDLEEGSIISEDSLHHRAKALYLIRQRLNLSNPFNDDSLIGAIALLAITEGLEGNFSLSITHVRALARLIGLRGGFDKLHKNEALSRLVAWADLCHSASSHNQRHLPGLFVSSDIVLPDNPATSLGSVAAAFQDTVRDVWSANTFHLVTLLAAVPRHPPAEETSANERQNTSRLIYCINQTLLSMNQDEGQLSQLLYDASLLYISLVLRQMPRRTKLIISRAEALYTSLENLHFDDYRHTSMESVCLLIQLWSYTIYFCSLLRQDRGSDLCTKMRQLFESLQINSIKSLEDRLGQISWVYGYGSQELEMLFRQHYLV